MYSCNLDTNVLKQLSRDMVIWNIEDCYSSRFLYSYQHRVFFVSISVWYCLQIIFHGIIILKCVVFDSLIFSVINGINLDFFITWMIVSSFMIVKLHADTWMLDINSLSLFNLDSVNFLRQYVNIFSLSFILWWAFTVSLTSPDIQNAQDNASSQFLSYFFLL